MLSCPECSQPVAEGDICPDCTAGGGMVILAARERVKREEAKKALEAKEATQRQASANPMRPAPKLDLPAPIASLSEIPIAPEPEPAAAEPPPVGAEAAPVQPVLSQPVAAPESFDPNAAYSEKTIVEGMMAPSLEELQRTMMLEEEKKQGGLERVQTGGGIREKTPSSQNKTIQLDESGAEELLEQIRLRREAAAAATGGEPVVQPQSDPVDVPALNVVVGSGLWALDDIAREAAESAAESAAAVPTEPTEPVESGPLNLAGKILRESPVAEHLPSHKLVTLADDEYVIAMAKPGAFLWISIVLAFLFVITIPLAILLLLRAGSEYWITTKRSLVLPIVGSKVRALDHQNLAAIESGAIWLAGPKRSLHLKPFDRAKVKPLSLPYCSRQDLMDLWGALVLWRMPQCDIFVAPPVDKRGNLFMPRSDLGVILIDAVELARDEGPIQGPCLVGADELVIYVAAGKGEKSFGPRLPIYQLLFGLCQNATSLAAFQLELRDMLSKRLIRKAWTAVWADYPQSALDDSGKLVLTSAAGKQNLVTIPRTQAAPLRAYLQQMGTLS